MTSFVVVVVVDYVAKCWLMFLSVFMRII